MTKQTPSSLLLVATIAGGIAFVAFVALMVVGDFTVSPAAFLAIVVALAAAIFLYQGFHKGSPRDKPELRALDKTRFGDVTLEAGSAGVTPGTAGTRTGTAGRTATGAVAASAIDRPLGADATGDAAGAAPRADLGGMPDPAAGGVSAKEPDRGLHGADEPAAPAAAAEAEPAPGGAEPEPGEAKWKSSQLAGTQELAEREGTWRYEPEAPAATDAPAPGSDHTAADPSVGAEDTRDVTIGSEPERLDGPRDGAPDDLQRISGIGPKLEGMLHRMGIYHFDQIAAWSDHEIAWVDERLEGFKGRVRRDDWVRQSRDLAHQGRE